MSSPQFWVAVSILVYAVISSASLIVFIRKRSINPRQLIFGLLFLLFGIGLCIVPLVPADRFAALTGIPNALHILIAALVVSALASFSALTKQFALENEQPLEWVIAFSAIGISLLLPIVSHLTGMVIPSASSVLLLYLTWIGIFAYRMAMFIRKALTYPNASHRNRLIHWLPLFLIIALADIYSFRSEFLIAITIRAVLIGWLTVLVYLPGLPDIQVLNRRILYFVINALMLCVLIMLSYLIGNRIFPDIIPAIELLPLIIFALILAVLVRSSQIVFTRMLAVILPLVSYDMKQTILAYSQDVSRVMDLDELADVMQDFVARSVEARHTELFLIEEETIDVTQPRLYLRAYGKDTNKTDAPLTVLSSDPIVQWMVEHQTVLTAFEVDMQPDIRANTAPYVRDWLFRNDIDVLVPIIAKSKWIGLLAVGSKRSAAPYTQADINLLQTLANQTAVALENARLVRSLSRLNAEYRRAYTSLEKSNQQLENSVHRIEAFDRTKSDFISITSHELRTPLTLISGYAQLIADEPSIQNEPGMAELAKGIMDGTNRMHDVIESMLDMASIDARSIELHVRDFDAHKLAGQVLQNIRENLQNRQLTFHIQPAPDIPQIQADPDALEKVFHHLINNAVKYTPDGGSITIQTKFTPKSQSPLQEDCVVISISDTGIGISKENLDLIFTKFYQTGKVTLHSSGKTKFMGGGPGLGLAIVRGIVELHRGKVWAVSAGASHESLPGSTFHIALPIVHQLVEAEQPDHHVQPFLDT